MGAPIRPKQRPEAESEERPLATDDLEVLRPEVLLKVSGPSGSHLRILGKELGVTVGLRGSTIRVQGETDTVRAVKRVLRELVDVVEQGAELNEVEIARMARFLRENPELGLKELFGEVVLMTFDRKVVSPKGLAQHDYVRAIREHDVVFGVGPAGTGKTYLAVGMAVRALQERRVKRLVLTRPAVEAGEKLGFLPGDIAEKVDPYLKPLFDALDDTMGIDRVRSSVQRGVIEIAPLAFMRGRTLNESFVILDEAQNTTPEQMKMFLTRLGVGSKAVITGDVTQIDLPEGRPSGLSEAASLLAGVEGIKVCWFRDADVVRHPLVQRIVRAYDERDATYAGKADP